MPAALCTVCCAAAGGNNLFVGAGQLFRPTINTQAGTSQPAGRGILNTTLELQTNLCEDLQSRIMSPTRV